MTTTGPHKNCLIVNYCMAHDKEVIHTVGSEKKKTKGEK